MTTLERKMTAIYLGAARNVLRAEAKAVAAGQEPNPGIRDIARGMLIRARSYRTGEALADCYSIGRAA